MKRHTISLFQHRLNISSKELNEIKTLIEKYPNAIKHIIKTMVECSDKTRKINLPNEEKCLIFTKTEQGFDVTFNSVTKTHQQSILKTFKNNLQEELIRRKTIKELQRQSLISKGLNQEIATQINDLLNELE